MAFGAKKPGPARSVGDLMLLMISEQEKLRSTPKITKRRGLFAARAPQIKREGQPRARIR